MDPRVSGRGQAAFVIGVGLVLTILGVFLAVASRIGAMEVTWPRMVLLAAGFAVTYGVAILVLRERVRWTRINRTIAWIGAAIILNLFLMRLAGWAIGLALYQEFIAELVVAFGQITLCGITVDRRMLWALPPFALASAPAFIWPAAILPAYSVATTTLFIAVAWIWYRNGVPQADPIVPT